MSPARALPPPLKNEPRSPQLPTPKPSVVVEETSAELGDESASPAMSPEDVKADPNPLNPAGEGLDQLIEMRINDDLWRSMLGDLPCLEAMEDCISRLQGLAVQNSRELKAIDQRVEAINHKINEAKANNRKSIRLGVFEPLVQSWLTLENLPTSPGGKPRRKGLLDRVGGLFLGNTFDSINEILSLIGVPLFRNVSGGDATAQQRAIGIADLQVKVAEVENKRGELAAKLREAVILQVLDYDQVRREFQLSQEVAKRASLRLKLLEVDYRFAAAGSSDTEGYLNQVSAVDQRKAESFRHWARLRSQMARIKLLVLGAGEE